MFNNLTSAHTDSIKLLRQLTQTDFAPILEVGLCQRTFIDPLLKDGYLNLTAIDISQEVVDLTKSKYPHYGSLVRWLCGDVFSAPLKQGYYALWHDGAVFEKLASIEQREGYIKLLESSLRPNGYAIIYASPVLEETILQIHETSLELVNGNWNALCSLYFGFDAGDVMAKSLNPASTRKFHVVKRKS